MQLIDMQKQIISSWKILIKITNLCISVTGTEIVYMNKQWFRQFTKSFTGNYSKDENYGYFHEVEVQYPKKWHDRHNDLSFLSERMKTEKYKKLEW